MMEIPESVLALMCEYDRDSLVELPNLPSAVIERIMIRGGREAMDWMLRTVDRGTLVEFLENRGWRVLPPREITFWSLACGVPESTAHSWAAQAGQQELAWRG